MYQFINKTKLYKLLTYLRCELSFLWLCTLFCAPQTSSLSRRRNMRNYILAINCTSGAFDGFFLLAFLTRKTNKTALLFMCHFNQGALQPKNETIPIYQVEREKRRKNWNWKLSIIRRTWKKAPSTFLCSISDEIFDESLERRAAD